MQSYQRLRIWADIQVEAFESSAAKVLGVYENWWKSLQSFSGAVSNHAVLRVIAWPIYHLMMALQGILVLLCVQWVAWPLLKGLVGSVASLFDVFLLPDWDFSAALANQPHTHKPSSKLDEQQHPYLIRQSRWVVGSLLLAALIALAVFASGATLGALPILSTGMTVGGIAAVGIWGLADYADTLRDRPDVDQINQAKPKKANQRNNDSFEMDEIMPVDEHGNPEERESQAGQWTRLRWTMRLLLSVLRMVPAVALLGAVSSGVIGGVGGTWTLFSAVTSSALANGIVTGLGMTAGMAASLVSFAVIAGAVLLALQLVSAACVARAATLEARAAECTQQASSLSKRHLTNAKWWRYAGKGISVFALMVLVAAAFALPFVQFYKLAIVPAYNTFMAAPLATQQWVVGIALGVMLGLPLLGYGVYRGLKFFSKRSGRDMRKIVFSEQTTAEDEYKLYDQLSEHSSQDKKRTMAGGQNTQFVMPRLTANKTQHGNDAENTAEKHQSDLASYPVVPENRPQENPQVAQAMEEQAALQQGAITNPGINTGPTPGHETVENTPAVENTSAKVAEALLGNAPETNAAKPDEADTNEVVEGKLTQVDPASDTGSSSKPFQCSPPATAIDPDDAKKVVQTYVIHAFADRFEVLSEAKRESSKYTFAYWESQARSGAITCFNAILEPCLDAEEQPSDVPDNVWSVFQSIKGAELKTFAAQMLGIRPGGTHHEYLDDFNSYFHDRVLECLKRDNIVLEELKDWGKGSDHEDKPGTCVVHS